MFEYLKKIWRSLKRFFRQLFSSSSRRIQTSTVTVQPLTDTDYEFLFSQLLEGVARGWHQGRVLKFFEQLEERTKMRDWLAWLNRFGERVLESNAPNHQLASRMIRLGEIAQSIPTLNNIGELCYNLGRQIFSRDSQGAVWEYQGNDIEEISTVPQTEENLPYNEAEGLTVEQLFAILQENPAVAEQMSEQLGLDTRDPHKIIEVLLEQIQETEFPEAGSIEYWNDLALQQLRQGQLEEAIASCDKALAINPERSKVWYNRANALTNLYRWDEALASYDEAIKLDNKDYLAWNGLANVYYSTNHIQESFECWDKVVQLKPDYDQAWYDRGYVLELLHRPTEAISSYQKAIQLKPDFPEVLARLKELQTEHGELF